MIKINNLKKSFGKKTVLKGIDLQVTQGEVMVIIGPSGSGKSTLLRCLNLLEKPDSGDIYLDDELITSPEANVDKVREKMGMVFQNFNLFPHKTVLQNIMLAPVKVKKVPVKEAEQQAVALLEKMGLTDKKDVFPNSLSGGQKQRVAIAGIVAMKPKCIILDEPTAMLDPSGRKEVISVLHELNEKENVTIILITHYMEEVIDADRVFVMDAGKIMMEGTPRQIFSNVEHLKELRLDVPQVTELAYELKKAGVPLPDGILTKEEFTLALKRLVMQNGD